MAEFEQSLNLQAHDLGINPDNFESQEALQEAIAARREEVGGETPAEAERREASEAQEASPEGAAGNDRGAVDTEASSPAEDSGEDRPSDV